MKLISQVCVRETENGLKDLWELAFKLYNEPTIRDGHMFYEPLRHLFSNLIKSTPHMQLIQQLPALFQLPVAGKSDFPVFMPDRWPDPATMLTCRFEARDWQQLSARWDEVKRRLFEDARTNNSYSERIAFVRLLKLNDRGALSDPERNRLAEIFWASLDNPDGLPMKVWDVEKSFYALCLPKPDGRIDACERVRKHILPDQLADVHWRLGEIHWGMVNQENYFNLICFATEQRHGASESSPHRWYIQWTKGEVRRLFETIRTWWENHGRKMAENLRQERSRRSNGPAVRRFMNGLWDVMRMAIIPRMVRRGPSVTAVMELIAEIESAGLPVGAVLPATLLLRPDTSSTVESALRQEFANPELDYYLSALRGVVYWVDQSGGKRGRRRAPLPTVPADLLREISMAVALRRPESLDLSLDAAYHVLRRLGKGADDRFVRNLMIGLNYLFGDTTYQEKAGVHGRIPYADVPNIRWQAARLAKCLSDCGHDSEPIIQRWSQAILDDPLPEVRWIATEPGIT